MFQPASAGEICCPLVASCTFALEVAYCASSWSDWAEREKCCPTDCLWSEAWLHLKRRGKIDAPARH